MLKKARYIKDLSKQSVPKKGAIDKWSAWYKKLKKVDIKRLNCWKMSV